MESLRDKINELVKAVPDEKLQTLLDFINHLLENDFHPVDDNEQLLMTHNFT